VQVVFAGTVPPANDTLDPPLAAVTVPLEQVVIPFGEAVFTNPAGYASVNATPVTAVAFGFVKAIVTRLTPFTAIAAGVKLFTIVRLLFTVNVPPDEPVVLLPPFVVVTPPAGIALVRLPEVVAVTFTVTAHDPFAGIVPLDNDTVPPPLAAVTVPVEQVVAPFGVLVFTRPDG